MHFDWWTLALQTVNVVILIWILGRFFFRPVANLVAKRREETTKRLADADAARKEADALRAEASTLRAGIDAQRDRLLADARKAAETEKAASLAQLTNELDQRRKDAATAIEKERTAMQRAVLERASELSVEIARRLLARVPTSVACSAFLEGLCAELNKLPLDSRKHLAAPDAEHPLDVVAATELDDEQSASLRQTIHSALGGELPMRLSCDPNLIAGFEIRGRNVIVRNNWQADLEIIRQELDR
jgi:F-type H+-transporting ATPase subunit b